MTSDVPTNMTFKEYLRSIRPIWLSKLMERRHNMADKDALELPEIIGPTTDLVCEITALCGNMEGTESLEEVVAGVLNAAKEYLLRAEEVKKATAPDVERVQEAYEECARIAESAPRDAARCAKLMLCEQAWDEGQEHAAKAIRAAKERAAAQSARPAMSESDIKQLVQESGGDVGWAIREAMRRHA